MLKKEAEKYLKNIAQSLAKLEIQLRLAEKPLDNVDELLRGLEDLEQALGLGTAVFDWDLFEDTWVSKALGREENPKAN